MTNQSEKKFWNNSEPESIIQEAVKYKPNGTVLDLGAGSGRDSLFLTKHLFEVTALDNDADSLIVIKTKAADQNLKIDLVNDDIHSYEPSKTFDIIICDMVLHFFSAQQIQELITKMQRWTSSKGLNVIAAYSDKNPTGKRPYLFKHNELKSLYPNWKVLVYEEKPTPWFQLPGETEPRRNHAVYLIAQKPK